MGAITVKRLFLSFGIPIGLLLVYLFIQFVPLLLEKRNVTNSSTLDTEILLSPADMLAFAGTWLLIAMALGLMIYIIWTWTEKKKQP